MQMVAVHIEPQLANQALRLFRATCSRDRLIGQASMAIDWPHLRPSYKRRRPQDRKTPPRALPDQRLLKLRLPAPPKLTPLMADVERALTRVAETGEAMPNNPALGERVGGRRRNSVDRALQRLEVMGRITIERRPGERRVHLVARGLRTGWGEARPGHQPFCSRGRNDPPLPPKPRQAESQPLPVGAVSLPPLASLVGFTFDKPSTAVGIAAICQWPMWDDGEKPNGSFCGKPVERNPERGKCGSWCAAHAKAVFR